MFKKKGKTAVKKSPKKDETLTDDSISSSAMDDFFKEPAFDEEEEVTAQDAQKVSSGSVDAEDVAEDDTSKKGKGGKKKGVKFNQKTILLSLLLVILGGFAVYTFVLPMYFPETPAAPPKVVSKPKVKKRIAIQAPSASAPQKAAGAKKVVAAEKKPVSAPAKTPVTAIKPSAEIKEAKKKVVPPVNVDEAVTEKKPVEVKVKPKKISGALINVAKLKTVDGNTPTSGATNYFIQTGVFIFKDSLNTAKKKIEKLGYVTRVEIGKKTVKMNRVMVGNWSYLDDAESAARELIDQGHDATVFTAGDDGYSVHIGSYYYKKLAKEKQVMLNVKGYDARINTNPIRMKVHYLLIGPYARLEEAKTVDTDLKEKGLQALVVSHTP